MAEHQRKAHHGPERAADEMRLPAADKIQQANDIIGKIFHRKWRTIRVDPAVPPGGPV
jgi:hypothetical protein